MLHNLLTHRRICGIHEKTAGHKGQNAAFSQQLHRLRKKIIVDGVIAQFRKIRIIKTLVAKRRVSYDEIKVRSCDLRVLKADIKVALVGIKKFGDG